MAVTGHLPTRWPRSAPGWIIVNNADAAEERE
jgi:hypothetical protein